MLLFQIYILFPLQSFPSRMDLLDLSHTPFLPPPLFCLSRVQPSTRNPFPRAKPPRLTLSLQLSRLLSRPPSLTLMIIPISMPFIYLPITPQLSSHYLTPLYIHPTSCRSCPPNEPSNGYPLTMITKSTFIGYQATPTSNSMSSRTP